MSRRSHPLNEISRKIVKELLSKHKLFDTLIELLTQGFRSSPPWCRDNVTTSGKEMQFKLPTHTHTHTTASKDRNGASSEYCDSRSERLTIVLGKLLSH